jgi:type I site-specific restriction endonuclease
MGLSESDTHAKLIDPATHARGWTQGLGRREETAGAIEIIARKAFNPNARRDQDTRTPDDLLDVIEAKGREVAAALAQLRRRG